MIKRIFIYSLPEGTNHDEFWKYHTEVHASDTKNAAGPRIKKYVINRVTKVLLGEPKFWVLIETWWENEDAMNEFVKNAETIKIPGGGGKTSFSDFFPRITEPFIALVEEKEIEL